MSPSLGVGDEPSSTLFQLTVSSQAGDSLSGFASTVLSMKVSPSKGSRSVVSCWVVDGCDVLGSSGSAAAPFGAPSFPSAVLPPSLLPHPPTPPPPPPRL